MKTLFIELVFFENWESLVTIQLPSDCWVGFWTNDSEKQDTITFCTNLPKKEMFPFLEMSRDNGQKRCVYK